MNASIIVITVWNLGGIMYRFGSGSSNRRLKHKGKYRCMITHLGFDASSWRKKHRTHWHIHSNKRSVWTISLYEIHLIYSSSIGNLEFPYICFNGTSICWWERVSILYGNRIFIRTIFNFFCCGRIFPFYVSIRFISSNRSKYRICPVSWTSDKMGRKRGSSKDTSRFCIL